MINAIVVENEKKAIKLITELLELNFSEIAIQAVCEILPDAVKPLIK
jgi:hypothetical protein